MSNAELYDHPLLFLMVNTNCLVEFIVAKIEHFHVGDVKETLPGRFDTNPPLLSINFFSLLGS